MARILIGVPHKPQRDTKLFDESLSLFMKEVRKKHQLEYCEYHGNRVDEVREEIIKELFRTNNEYLLFQPAYYLQLGDLCQECRTKLFDIVKAAFPHAKLVKKDD